MPDVPPALTSELEPGDWEEWEVFCDGDKGGFSCAKKQKLIVSYYWELKVGQG